MKVTLISHTPNADRLLVFTKKTRLEMTPSLYQEILSAPQEAIDKELDYMADTIPSSWEFVDYVFLVQGVSRAYTHQQVRTRTASFAQQTMRVLNMGEYNYIPTVRNAKSPEAMELIEAHKEMTQLTYKKLIEIGQMPEDARGVLPTNIETNIVCKFNLRTLSELAKSRSGGRTQQEYQNVVNRMVDAVLEVHPWAEKFLFASHDRNYFDEIEAFAEREFGGDLIKKGELLKIVDKMRKG